MNNRYSKIYLLIYSSRAADKDPELELPLLLLLSEPNSVSPSPPIWPNLSNAFPDKLNGLSEESVIIPPVTVVPDATARPNLVPFPEVVTQIFLPSGAVSTKR